jgi:acyl-CoA thioesterase-1
MTESAFNTAGTSMRRFHLIITIAALFAMLGLDGAAWAAPVTIVAIGASNTVGRGGTSYPAELEAMLKARGYQARVINAGLNGDTTAGMAARLGSAVPNGTRVVLINPANLNDTKAGIRGQQSAYVAQMRKELSARGIKSIVMPALIRMTGGGNHSDSEHFDADGYRKIAAGILPQVIAAIGKP